MININAEAMNPVTEKKQQRHSILTKDVMAGIPVLVQQGLNAEAIAARLGCNSWHTQGALLTGSDQPARTQRGQGGADGAAGASAPAAKAAKAKAVLRLCLAGHTATQPSCHVPAAPAGGSHRCERSPTSSDLLEVIAQDDLYDAVLDSKAKKISA